MAAAPDSACLSDLAGPPHRNLSFVSGTRSCNRSAVRPSPYSPQATAAFAISITFMMTLTIVGNILVIIAVLTSRSLKGPQNLFLVSLAAADILVATLIIPFSLANELQGFWAFSSIWCEIYLALDVLFCTSSIVHLCAIALDRYLSISQPVTYGAKRTPLRIKAAIIVVWLISAVISFPPLLSLDKSEGGAEVCELNSERWYILYSTIGSFFVPCVIMILVYVRIYQIAKKHTRCPPKDKNQGPARRAAVVGKEPAETPDPRVSHQEGEDAENPSSRKEDVIKKTSHLDSVATPAQKQPDCTESRGTHFDLPTRVQRSTSTQSAPHPDVHGSFSAEQQKPLKQPDKGWNSEAGDLHDNTSSFGSDMELEVGDEEAAAEEDKGEGDGQRSDGGTVRSSPAKGFKVHVHNLACRYKQTVATSSGTTLVCEGATKLQVTSISRRKAMVNREKRFTFVLAVVMGVFVICWFPFFFSYSLQAVCPETCSIPPPLFKFFFWIGYCNSCLNPVIYTIFNKDFRKAFKRILCRDAKGTFF